MDKLISYNELMELRARENTLQKEEHEEKAHMWIVANKNKSDVCLSEKGKKFSRKLMSRINNFYKSIEKAELNDKFLMSNTKQVVEHFKAYLLERVKGKEKEEYELAFRSNDFERDVFNLIRQKIYEHKQELELAGELGFLSAEAKCLSSMMLVVKSIRQSSHESTGRIAKVTLTMLDGSKEKLTDEQLKQITPMIEQSCDEILAKEMNRTLKVDFLNKELIGIN